MDVRRTLSGTAALAAGALVTSRTEWGSATAAAPRITEPAVPPPDDAFQKVTLNDRTGEPMDLAVLPNGDVLHTTRKGVIWRNSARTDVDIVGNEAPVVTLVQPTEGQAFQSGDTMTYEVTVTDDQDVDCSKVRVPYVLGHDDHGHPQTTAGGCTGSITTTVPSGHDPARCRR
jgi:glucose/arabinose dehydrogenase